MAHGGHCVARHQGRVVFVRHALPGETVLARLTDSADQAKFWRADAVEILLASPDRVVPPCPLAGPGRCGGCDWQHASPQAQRALKAAVITEQLHRLAKLEPGADGGFAQVVVEPVPLPERSASSEGSGGSEGSGSPEGSGRSDGSDGLGWRTRVRFAVDVNAKVGLRRHRSHDVIPVEKCLIADPAVASLQLAQPRWRGAAAVEVITPVDGDPLVIVESAAEIAGSGAKLRLPRLPVPAALATRDAGGLHQVKGRKWVSERVLIDGRPQSFRITGTGFWQVHPGAAQTLLDAVLAASRPRPGERAVDLYGGVGLFAAGLADAVGQTGSVVLVESDPRASSDARRSLHDLGWIRFETGPVERLLPQLSSPGGPLDGGADVVVLDPPRAGAGKAVMSQIAALRPRVIVYVACDPAALARDLATAATLGYRLAGLRAFDLFPMTHHVECVATLVSSGER